jgi:hypothetical protein
MHFKKIEIILTIADKQDKSKNIIPPIYSKKSIIELVIYCHVEEETHLLSISK